MIYIRNSEWWNFLLTPVCSGDIGHCVSWSINYHKRPLTPERLPFRSWSSSAPGELGRLVCGMPAVALTNRWMRSHFPFCAIRRRSQCSAGYQESTAKQGALPWSLSSCWLLATTSILLLTPCSPQRHLCLGII